MSSGKTKRSNSPVRGPAPREPASEEPRGAASAVADPPAEVDRQADELAVAAPMEPGPAEQSIGDALDSVLQDAEEMTLRASAHADRDKLDARRAYCEILMRPQGSFADTLRGLMVSLNLTAAQVRNDADTVRTIFRARKEIQEGAVVAASLPALREAVKSAMRALEAAESQVRQASAMASGASSRKSEIVQLSCSARHLFAPLPPGVPAHEVKLLAETSIDDS